MSDKIGLFAGSFDPITKGHIDLIKRASKLFDCLYVGIFYNLEKKSFFSIEAKEKSKNIEEINGVQFLYVSESKDASIAKQMTFELRDQLTNGVVVLVSEYEGKTSYFVGLTASMVKNGYKAGDLVKMINEVTGGRGGGKPDFAQGGCPSQEHINDAIKQIKSVF